MCIRLWQFPVCWYTCLLYIYVDNISHFWLSVYFWQIKRFLVFQCGLRSFTIQNKKWIKESLLSFVQKMKLNVQGHLKYWLWHLESLLWVEHKFNCGIIVLRNAEKMTMKMLVLVVRARQQELKTLKQWRKWIWINTWFWHIFRFMPSNFWECFRHKIFGSEDCSKLAKFWRKTTSQRHHILSCWRHSTMIQISSKRS